MGEERRANLMNSNDVCPLEQVEVLRNEIQLVVDGYNIPRGGGGGCGGRSSSNNSNTNSDNDDGFLHVLSKIDTSMHLSQLIECVRNRRESDEYSEKFVSISIKSTSGDFHTFHTIRRAGF